MKERIHLYYTNDLHSHFENWPKATAFIKHKKKRAKALGEFALAVDIGDHMDRVNPITDATLGKANVSLLNEAGYDVVTLGNNEGITLSHEDLYQLYDDAAFAVVCSNLENLEGANPAWLRDYEIWTTSSGIRIGLFGMTARFNPYYNLLGWNAEEVPETIDHVLRKLRDQTDVIVLLSHLGINEDRTIAKKHPEIDVIIGGHTHHLLKTGEEVNQTILTAGGKMVAYAGEVNLLWDHEKNELVKKEAHTVDVTHLSEDPSTLEHLQGWKAIADRLMEAPVAKTATPLLVDWYEDTPIMEVMTHTLLKWTDADVAMLNAGLLLHSLQPGIITYKDIHAICPHPINPVVVELTGEELIEVVRASLTDHFMNIELKGFGFRGKILGRMIFAGMRVQTEMLREGIYVKDVLYHGTPVKKGQLYRVATGDLFTFGNLLPPVARSPVKDLFLPEFIRDLLKETLRNEN